VSPSTNALAETSIAYYFPTTSRFAKTRRKSFLQTKADNEYDFASFAMQCN